MGVSCCHLVAKRPADLQLRNTAPDLLPAPSTATQQERRNANPVTGALLDPAPATLDRMSTHPLTGEERSDLMRLALRAAPEAAGLLWLMLHDNPRAGWRTVIVADNYVYRGDQFGFPDGWAKGRLAELERAQVIRSVVVAKKDGTLFGVDEYLLVRPA